MDCEEDDPFFKCPDRATERHAVLSNSTDGLAGWISVYDALPEIGVDVLATDAEDFKEVGFRSSIDTEPHDWVDFHFTVKYWMSIPKTPTC
jgi:hypothetical protein